MKAFWLIQVQSSKSKLAYQTQNQLSESQIMNNERIQLTLFVKQEESAEIETIREKYNPEQFRLISAHVTLCREEELTDLPDILKILENLNAFEIVVDFGPAEKFANGIGVLLPGLGDNTSFQNLRKLILSGNPVIRKHEPHITLMHPRNSTCTDAVFLHIKKQNIPNKLIFNKISLIKQKNGMAWEILKEFELATEI